MLLQQPDQTETGSMVFTVPADIVTFVSWLEAFILWKERDWENLGTYLRIVTRDGKPKLEFES